VFGGIDIDVLSDCLLLLVKGIPEYALKRKEKNFFSKEE
jgi:hypothetical protein